MIREVSKKKTRPAVGRQPHNFELKIEDLSRMPRNSRTPCPTHTQKARYPMSVPIYLHVLWKIGQGREFFFTYGRRTSAPAGAQTLHARVPTRHPDHLIRSTNLEGAASSSIP